MTAREAESAPRLAVALKGYPRLSETFIAQELKALEERGFAFDIWSLRHPYDDKTHPIHDAIRARARYLPEYLHQEPLRVLRGWRAARRMPGYAAARRVWLHDLARDRTRNRIRRWGQALTLAAELAPETDFIYAHFLHTPASVARYAAMIRGVAWGFSAHAKDIWTIPDWEKREKLADCRFGVTCTGTGARHLNGLAPREDTVSLIYHGLDLSRFPPPPERRPERDGRTPGAPIVLLSVGRLVAKKGYDDLLAALAALPAAIHWRFVHIGGGPLKEAMVSAAERLGIADRIDWRGKRDQTEVISALREADIFILPSKIAGDGDRDGLPNVLMEAASQRLPILSTAVSAIPEFIEDGVHGRLAPPGAPEALAAAMIDMIGKAGNRASLARSAYDRLKRDFGMEEGIDVLESLIGAALNDAAKARAR
ncbi:glycosyltransferase [Pikeienuella sp. HZG-20]|uniref:glycosyltransferase n=1 Tax=Paludibacillus litoralis TaxID=3133267 RepID=UPI0030EB9292